MDSHGCVGTCDNLPNVRDAQQDPHPDGMRLDCRLVQQLSEQREDSLGRTLRIPRPVCRRREGTLPTPEEELIFVLSPSLLRPRGCEIFDARA